MYQAPVLQWANGFIDKINLNGCRHILDVGCRTGEHSVSLAKRNPTARFTAIDTQASNIEKASQYVLPNLQFEVIDVLNMTDYYDAAVSFNYLHWVDNKYKILSHIFKALKMGGKFHLQFIAKHGRSRNDRFLYQTALSASWKNYFKNFLPKYNLVSAAQISGLLQNIGFIIHKLEFVPYTTIFSDLEQVKTWFNSWASHKERLPRQKQDHFFQQVTHAYMHDNYAQNKIPYTEYLLEIICEKPVSPILSDSAATQYGAIVFTPHEVNVLKYFLKGQSAKEIAHSNNVTAKTIEFHIANIKEKLNCHGRSEIYQAAIAHGFIHLLFD